MDIYFLQVYFIILITGTIFVISDGSSLAESTIWTLDRYRNITRIKRQIDCSERTFECQNGQCINKEQICDGITNCKDGSDETKELCGTFRCTKLVRCDYGACVNAQAKCNGRKECADGSDENHCENISTSLSIQNLESPLRPPIPQALPVLSTRPSIPQAFSVLRTHPIPPQPTAGSCLMPENPPNGVYTVGIYNTGEYKIIYNTREYVPPFNALVLKCNRLYKPTVSELKAIPLCLKGKWTVAPPTCVSYCAVPKLPPSTKITCKFNGRTLNSCEDAIEDTILTLKCAPSYEQPRSGYPARICRDGNWNSSLEACIPVCGIVRPIPIVNNGWVAYEITYVNGTIIKKGDYPWHVGIYSRSSNNGLICGGTIINQRVILTAAQCVTDSEGQAQPKEEYIVAGGKHYRSYEDPRDEGAQYSEVHSIHIAERYNGSITDFGADIAVLILEREFQFSTSVQPVCVDWDSNFETEQLSKNNVGRIVGWEHSIPQGKQLEELTVTRLPYLSLTACINNVPKHFRRFITFDKICAGYFDQATSTCQYGSGEGLSFPWYRNRHYIRGIMSIPPDMETNSSVACGTRGYNTFTLVSKHIEFIRKLEAYYRPLIDEN